MGINTIIENLDNTIAGKQALRSSLESNSSRGPDSDLVARVTVQFLEINIEELARIRNALVGVRNEQETKMKEIYQWALPIYESNHNATTTSRAMSIMQSANSTNS